VTSWKKFHVVYQKPPINNSLRFRREANLFLNYFISRKRLSTIPPDESFAIKHQIDGNSSQISAMQFWPVLSVGCCAAIIKNPLIANSAKEQLSSRSGEK